MDVFPVPASPVISRMVAVGMREEEEDGDIESSEGPHEIAASKKDIPVVEQLDQGSDSVTAGCQFWSRGGGCRDRSQRSYKVSVVVVVVAAAVVGWGKSLIIMNSFLNQQQYYLVLY